MEDLEKNTKLILTTTAGDLAEAGLITNVLQPDFELIFLSGELYLYGIARQDRQVLDIVKIGSEISENLVCYPSFIHMCGKEMDNMNNFLLDEIHDKLDYLMDLYTQKDAGLKWLGQ